jgi:putative membrane protein
MRNRALIGAALIAALAACGPLGQEGSVPEAGESNEAANAAAPSAPTAAPGPATAADGRHYVELAGAADTYMIEAGRLGVERARNAGVRALAQKMLDDHRRSAGALGRAAGAADPAIATVPSLTPYQVESLEALRAAPPAAFDRAFLGRQLEDQERLLTLLTAYAINGDVDSLRRQASEAAEPVRENLSRVRGLIVEIPFEEAPAKAGTRPNPAR